MLVAFGMHPLCMLARWVIPPRHEIVEVIQAFSCLITAVSLIWVFSYTANDSRGRFSGFPSWMYTLPLRTTMLVFWPMLLGTLFMAVAVTLWEITICHYENIALE